jgi:hypothetical protein
MKYFNVSIVFHYDTTLEVSDDWEMTDPNVGILLATIDLSKGKFEPITATVVKADKDGEETTTEYGTFAF